MGQMKGDVGAPPGVGGSPDLSQSRGDPACPAGSEETHLALSFSQQASGGPAAASCSFFLFCSVSLPLRLTLLPSFLVSFFKNT